MTKTVKTAFEIVEVLLELEGAGVAELADSVDIPTSTAHDYLQGLEEIGCTVKEDGTYRVGSRFLSIGEQMRNQLEIYTVAKPELQNLATTTGEHASLMIEENNYGILLYTATGEQAVELDIHDGIATKLHTTALGKSILAHMEPEKRERILDQDTLPTRTSNTITEKAELLDEIERIRDQRYALDQEELFEGMNGVGVPIIVSGEVRGAIGVYGPTGRMNKAALPGELSKTVLETANVIEVSLKY
ncbi:MAG: IclR family acetate operon transcriptional repressor [Natronomonas sp.]|jgi:IclR family acetate operon transcriptional repressor|uniref:IclR family transcriptional regulator n=1 Tax=Natronomonas sp. TaxID=2184060 RepID=UPI003988A2C9